MRKYKLFIGYRLLGEFSGIWEAKNFAAESGRGRHLVSDGGPCQDPLF